MPRLSIIVVVYRIPRQAENTLYSLSARHQRHVNEEDYEILVVENSSDAELGAERAEACGKNVRYFRREEPGVSPVPAVNFGFAEARAPLIALIVDGAHMVTPGLVEHGLLAAELHEQPVIIVPAHHLGQVEHHLNRTASYDEAVEQRLLESANWKTDGYSLFDIGCWSGANHSGSLCPAIESGCIIFTRDSFEAIGHADERFDSPGGGIFNQDLFVSLCRLRGTRFIVLAGEGSFHQFHGGVSTTELEGRDELMDSLRAQYERIRGQQLAGHERELVLFGRMAPQALPFLKRSAELAMYRHRMCLKQGRPEWPNDP